MTKCTQHSEATDFVLQSRHFSFQHGFPEARAELEENAAQSSHLGPTRRGRQPWALPPACAINLDEERASPKNSSPEIAFNRRTL